MKRARSDDEKDARRRLLLAAALDEFFERGFSAARMADIATRAELSKGTVYLYFESKDELFRELIETLAVPNLETIERMTRTAPSFEAAMAAIATFAPQLIRETHLHKLMKVLTGDSHSFPDIVASYRRDVIDRVLAAVTALLQNAHDAGEISVAEPALTARLVVAPMIMSMLWQAVFAPTDRVPIDLETLFQLHAENMKRALACPEPAS
ncbi:MAG: helix-turn-helix domain-containing protein [Pseudomonadota bacterium]